MPIYDFGEHEDAPYLVMRYMSGGTLRDRMKGDPLPMEEIAAMLNRLAPALDYAHEVGVIHRDLKPANILFDHQGSSYLADFGIARLAEASQTMTIIGTPAYMSPEQVESQVKLDGRSDIYALGVMLYELLAGEPPYTAETPTGQMLMHITMPVPDVTAAGRDLPPGTQGVIEKAMAKDREQRYQSAAELATAVQSLLTSEATPGEDAAVAAGLAATAVKTVEETPEPAAEEIPGTPPTTMEPLADATLEDGAEQVLLNTLAEEAVESEQAAEPIIAAVTAGDSDVLPLSDAGSEKGGGLPGWIWWVGALALLLIVVLGIRAVLSGGDNENAVVASPAAPIEEAAAVAEAEATPPEDVKIEEETAGGGEAAGEEKAGATATVTSPPTETPTEEPSTTPIPTETPAEEPSPTPTISPLFDARLGETWERPADGMTMVYVPKGSFPMGSEESDIEKPVHEVSLDAFWIDRTEVTNAQFAMFVEATGHETTAEEEGSGIVFTGEEWEDTEGADWQHPQGPGSDLDGLEDYPVVLVSWYDAESYCEWADARLPSEAEWEYAARGPEGLTYPWGNSFDGEEAYFCDANCTFDWADESADDGYEFTSPVGSYAAGESWAGALDMSGNVWEWVNDWYGETYYADSPADSPRGPGSGEFKVLRGGSWGIGFEIFLRGANRYSGLPGLRLVSIGFRCVVSPGS